MKTIGLRKTISVILAVLLLVCLAAGCGASQNETEPTQAPATQAPDQTESSVPAVTESEAQPADGNEILDRDGKLLGRIDKSAVVSAADEGIFYSLFTPDEYQFAAPAQYRFFRLSDGKDVLLGTLEDQGYEAVYARTEMDGIVYTLALTGNPYDSTPDALWLLAFDPVRETMNKIRVSESASPYAAMTASDGRVLIMLHELGAKKVDRVLSFDPASGAVQEVLSFSSEGNDSVSLRSLYADGERLYMLRLTIRGGIQEELYLDTYDYANGKLSERPLRELIFSEEYPGIVSAGDELSELGMLVSGFAVLEGRYLFYENFSVVRALVDLETGRNLFAKDDNYALSIGGGTPLFYFYDLGQAAPGSDVQGGYALRDGAVEKLSFTPPDARNMIRGVSVSPGGTWLVSFSNSDPREAAANALLLWKEP